ncbi:MAG: hypothetical protein QOH53_1137, partial [Ilumatobacteraceae bacterium]
LVADHDCRRGLVDVGDIPLRSTTRKPNAAALSQRHHLDRGHIAQHGAGRVNDGPFSERDSLAEERLAAAGLGDEAHVLAVGLLCRSETERGCPVADLRLRQMPNGKHGTA